MNMKKIIRIIALFLALLTILGMAVAYAEGYLSQKYKGGMWLIIEQGLKSKPLAIAYSLFATLACFGMGIMAQTNSVSEGLAEFGVPPAATAVAVSGLLLCCLVMGSGKIGKLPGVSAKAAYSK